ncbi:hypothetical protein MALGJ_05710 [Mycolicibacter algericus]|uniref:AMP-dependent synthetase/ligase domain-containing protein n=1 Tax=Mycolicibacter algericus TaxID=1288388 RepID=A0A7I9Y5E2_MYCAL|nr:hypothetical protein MALGJ_05710 [Mycolicibacter algericus]
MQIREYADSDRPAIIVHPSGTVIGFAELEARANRLAHYLREAGLREGDIVATTLENNESPIRLCGPRGAAACTTL